MNAVFFILFAVAQARFNQEQVPIPAIAAVQGGAPGVAQTIAGAAAQICSPVPMLLKRGDQILQELGTGADAVAAAIGIVAAEKNFNPFAQSIPTICSDPTLPANEMLRGITPLIDPAVGGSDVANALSAQTKKTPLDAAGKSVANLLAENGFTNFTTQDAAGNKGDAPASAGSGAGTGSAAVDTASTSTAVNTAAAGDTATAPAAATDVCAAQVAAALASAWAAQATAATGANTNATVIGTVAAAVDTSSAQTVTQTAAPAAGPNDTIGAGAPTSTNGVDFGLCNPTMKFEGGLGGRPATEFTFQSQDPKNEAIQQEALNPNIITNRICDELTNQCKSNTAAKALCKSAQAQIQALGTRDVTTAQTWNSLLGFAGTSTNPDGGPATPQEAGATATVARRSLGFRA